MICKYLLPFSRLPLYFVAGFLCYAKAFNFGLVPFVYFCFLVFFFFLHFLPLCWSCHCVHPFFSWDWWASIWALLWNVYQVDCLFPLCLVLLVFLPLGFCLFLSFGTQSSVPSFCLTLCVCFYVLVISAPSPSLEGVTLCKRFLLGSRRAISPVTRARHCRGVHCMGCISPPVAQIPPFLWEHCGGGAGPRLAGWKTWSQLLQMPCWSWLAQVWLAMGPSHNPCRCTGGRGWSPEMEATLEEVA